LQSISGRADDFVIPVRILCGRLRFDLARCNQEVEIRSKWSGNETVEAVRRPLQTESHGGCDGLFVS